MRPLKLCVLIVVLLLVGACGGDDVDTGTTTVPSSESTSSESTTTVTTGEAEESTTTTGDSDESTTTVTTATSSTTAEADGRGGGGSGVVNVSLESIDGFFIEGFEVGLRFETPGGDVLAATLWSDVVAAAGDSSPDAFYTAVHAQPVPAGDIVVLATVSIGIGPGPVTPDLVGPMSCELAVDVPAGGEVNVEVAFEDRDCLSEL